LGWPELAPASGKGPEAGLFSRRLGNNEPAWLDGLCHAGRGRLATRDARALRTPSVAQRGGAIEGDPTAVVEQALCNGV
jgi:hypothetical protein